MYPPEAIEHVVVIGAGTMGAGIAQLVAQTGRRVSLYDAQPETLPQARQRIDQQLQGGVDRGKISAEDKAAALARIETLSSLEGVRAELFIEAIVEQLEAKQAVLGQVAAHNDARTILATNTSSLPISRLARDLPHPERVVGMHFFNPAHVMKLVEVIQGAATAEPTVRTVFALAEAMGKKPVMAADSPGFIVNRVARPFYVEGLKLVEEGVADVETVDRLLESSGFRMGPFRLMDLIGVDANFNVTRAMYESFWYEPRFQPSRVQQQKVDAGHWGRKTGRGFYRYEEKS
jgi:3-hydroxybutyryl-CoA dehydrogenase